MKKLMNELGSNKTPFLFILDYELINPLVIRLTDVDSGNIKYKFGLQQNYKNKTIGKIPNLSYKPISKIVYKKAFDQVIDEQIKGNNYLLNLTFSTKISDTLSLTDIFYASNAKYKLLMDDKIVVFSPETFVKITDGEIYSYPMKGTIDASIPNAKDLLLADKKENQEHTTIVDLIRNDLSLVSKDVIVTKFKYIEEITTSNKTLLQMSSEIKGNLNENYNNKLGDIIYALLPAGSVTGAPKKKCVELINKIENHKRGYYSGIMGIFDGNNIDSAVMIRFIEKQQNDYYYKSGGGIRIDSSIDKEYQELNDKIYLPIY
jgi:para-aminobenzoate synthetase component 1